eukprot:4362824-Prymnesium_polylepis.1
MKRAPTVLGEMRASEHAVLRWEAGQTCAHKCAHTLGGHRVRVWRARYLSSDTSAIRFALASSSTLRACEHRCPSQGALGKALVRGVCVLTGYEDEGRERGVCVGGGLCQRWGAREATTHLLRPVILPHTEARDQLRTAQPRARLRQQLLLPHRLEIEVLPRRPAAQDALVGHPARRALPDHLDALLLLLLLERRHPLLD